jgi:hypothetical protein
MKNSRRGLYTLYGSNLHHKTKKLPSVVWKSYGGLIGNEINSGGYDSNYSEDSGFDSDSPMI